MEFGIFMLLAGVLVGIGACYDELREIHRTIKSSGGDRE